MALARFMWNNLIDTATLTESSEDTYFPVENIANALRSKPWRTGTSTALETVIIDLGSAQAVECVALLDHGLTAADTGITLEGNTADSWGSPAFTQNLTRVAGTIAAFFALESYRYWRISFTKSASGETRDIGRVFLGEFISAPITGHSAAVVDTSKIIRSVGGQTFSDERPIFYRIALQLNVITKSVADSLRTMLETIGRRRPFFVSIDDDEEPVNWIYYVKVSGGGSFTAISGNDYWRTTLNLDEQL